MDAFFNHLLSGKLLIGQTFISTLVTNSSNSPQETFLWGLPYLSLVKCNVTGIL
mgnify:CR=1 FL=1